MTRRATYQSTATGPGDRRIRRFGWSVALAMLLISNNVWAENQWDISPYDVRLWIMTDGSAEMDAWGSRLPKFVADELVLRNGASWSVTARVLTTTSVSDIEATTLESIASVDAAAIKADKIFLVRLNHDATQFGVSVGEFDCHTHRIGTVVARPVIQGDRLGIQIAQAVLEAFSPIGMIGRSKDDAVVIRMRAGLLDVARQTPNTPEHGDLLNVVLRRSDRLGNPVPNGIETVAWTVLRVGPKPDDSELLLPPGAIYCQISSGLRNPIRARGSRRVERFALTTKISFQSTILKLVDRADAKKHLAGYDVYQRLPGEKATAFVGRSDWQGELAIERDEHPLRTFYIKNGDRLIARLPIVIGEKRQVTAPLADDSLRLEAEGFVKSIREEIVDLVARRKILTLRFRKRLEDERVNDAESLLDELRQLETRQDIERRVREREANFQTRDKAQQDRINRLFRDTRSLLSKHLSSRDIDALRNELADAKRNQPTSPANPSAGQ